MRRLLSTLVIGLLVASGLAGTASPSQALPPGPSLDWNAELPLPPDDLAVTDAVLAGDRVWAVLKPVSGSLSERRLWWTPSNGRGAWQKYESASGEELVTGFITGAGGSALSLLVAGGSTADSLIVSPEGERRVEDEIALVGPGGRLVLTLGPVGSLEATVSTLDGQDLMTVPTKDAAIDGGRVWWHDGGRLRSRDLLDGGESLTITPDPAFCLTGAPAPRGRWLSVGCTGSEEVVDLSGTLRTGFLTEGTVEVGHGFLVHADAQGLRLVDPTTLATTKIPFWRDLVPDAADTARVLARPVSGPMVVMDVAGLRSEAPLDTTAPEVALDPLPSHLDQLATGGPTGLSVPVSWSPTDEPVRYEVRDMYPPLPLLTSRTVQFFGHELEPCVAVRATDRAGNVGPWDEHCFTWDRYRPRAGTPSVRASVDGFGMQRSFAHRHPITDDGGVARYQHRYRRGDRRGVMGDWSAIRGIASYRVNSVVRAGRRACHQIRGIDHFGRAIPWANTRVSCATAPYDDRLLRHSGRYSRPHKPGALDVAATALPPGSSVTVPELLHGSQLAVKVWQGPDQLGVLDVYRDGAWVRSIAPWSRRRGFAWVLVPRALRESGSRITLKAREQPVAVDAVGVRRPGDLYPPAG